MRLISCTSKALKTRTATGEHTHTHTPSCLTKTNTFQIWHPRCSLDMFFKKCHRVSPRPCLQGVVGVSKLPYGCNCYAAVAWEQTPCSQRCQHKLPGPSKGPRRHSVHLGESIKLVKSCETCMFCNAWVCACACTSSDSASYYASSLNRGALGPQSAIDNQDCQPQWPQVHDKDIFLRNQRLWKCVEAQ